MHYTYNPNTGRISGFSEKHGTANGATVLAKGSANGLQTYCYDGADRTISSGFGFGDGTVAAVDKDNILSFVVFDYYGRTVNSYSTDAYKKIIYGASAGKYQTNSSTNARNNRLLTSSAVGTQPENYVRNSGFESDASNWTDASTSSAKKHFGSKSSKLSSGGSISQTLTGLEAGAYYVLSAYVNTAEATLLSGRATAELELFGWQIEFGVSGDLLSVGAEAMIGVFPDEGFTAKASVGAGLFGGGFVFRVKPNQ